MVRFSGGDRPGHPLALLALPLALLAITGCGDTKPAKIDLAAPAGSIVNRNPLPLHASVENAKGEILAGQSLAYRSTAPEALEVSSDGSLLCLKTGDATVIVSGGGLTRNVSIACRIPSMIDMPPDLRLDLAKGAVTLQARALGEGGVPLTGVAVPIASSDVSIVTVEGSRLKPVAVGRTTLRAALDPIVAVTRVEVVNTVVSERMTLADGKARAFELAPGTYHVMVDFKAALNVRQGVALSWSGPSCPAQLEQMTHDLTCRTEVPATLTVTNPAQIGVGVPVVGSVTVERVPAP